MIGERHFSSRRAACRRAALALTLAVGCSALASAAEQGAPAPPAPPAPTVEEPTGSAHVPLPAPAPAAVPPAAPGPADAKPATTPPAPPPPAPSDARPAKQEPTTADEWRKRIDALETAIRTGKQRAKAANALLDELEADFWPKRAAVHASVERADAGFVDRQAALDRLYRQRERLFALVTPELRLQLGGLGDEGRASLRLELAYLQTRLLTQLRALERGIGQVQDNVSDSPLITLWRLLQVILAVLIFRGWRRWSPKGLEGVRKALLSDERPSTVSVALARLVWYLGRINGPLSWLVLVFVLSRLIMPRGFGEVAGLVYTIVLWILVARVVVLLIDAMAVHGIGGLRGGSRELRLRTLRLVAAWTVLLGLGLALARRYVGAGSIYLLGLHVWQILTAPLALLVIYWWRSEIFQRLEALSEQSDSARRLQSVRTGLWSYPAAVLGAGYLTWEWVFRLLIVRLSRFEAGRRWLAVLVRSQAAPESEASARKDERPLPPELQAALLAADGGLVEAVAREQLDLLLQSIRAANGGAHVVVAERGGGKTTLLRRLADALDGEMRTVSCPHGGHPALQSALARELGLDEGGAADELLPRAILDSGLGVLALDDAHRLARPTMGGQEGIQYIAALDERLDGRIGWIFTLDRCAWHYIRLALGDRALLQRVIELPDWSEEQLGELVSARCGAAGIEPDYTRIVLPRRLDTGEHDELAERNRFGYLRILWELADGNPEVAMALFADSLRIGPGDAVIAHLPQAPLSAALLDASVDTLLVLRVILQCDVADPEDVARSLRISPARAAAGVRFCHQNGWLEEAEGGLRVRLHWYPSITRMLERRNLMPH